MRQGERGHGKRLDSGGGLGPDQKLTAIEALNPHAGEWPQSEGYDLSREGNDAEQKRGVSQTIDEPTRGEARHPSTDHRDALPDEEELKVAMPQGAPGVGHRALGCLRRNGAGSGFLHNSTRRLMMSPAAKRVSWSCLSS